MRSKRTWKFEWGKKKNEKEEERGEWYLTFDGTNLEANM